MQSAGTSEHHDITYQEHAVERSKAGWSDTNRALLLPLVDMRGNMRCTACGGQPKPKHGRNILRPLSSAEELLQKRPEVETTRLFSRRRRRTWEVSVVEQWNRPYAHKNCAFDVKDDGNTANKQEIRSPFCTSKLEHRTSRR